MKTKSCVVDCQGFQYKETNFICKELAIKPVFSCCNSIKYYLFNFDLTSNMLSNDFVNHLNFLKKHIHGLTWETNFSENIRNYTELQKILYDEIITKGYKTVYVKGKQKKDWLYKMLDRVLNQDNCVIDIINIETYFDCPKLVELKQQSEHIKDCSEIIKCDKHVEMNNHYFKQCVKENVIIISDWVVEKTYCNCQL